MSAKSEFDEWFDAKYKGSLTVADSFLRRLAQEAWDEGREQYRQKLFVRLGGVL